VTAISLSTIWTVFFYGWFASEIYIGIRTRTRHSTGNVRDRGTLRLLWIVICASVAGAMWIGETTPENMFAGAHWLKVVSLLVLIFGLGLRWAAILTLGKSFSSNVAIQSTQIVHKAGLYRWMRHPSYTGLILCFLAIGLHMRNWISLLVVTIPTTAVLLYRIHVEEIALREAFGAEYIEYSAETSRLIPGVY
jgi:protein-S-isoprenylcysteine O-methyltransferase Ste14